MAQRVTPTGFADTGASADRVTPTGFTAATKAPLGAGEGELIRGIGEFTLIAEGRPPAGGSLASVGHAGAAANRSPSGWLQVTTTRAIEAGATVLAAIVHDRTTPTTVIAGLGELGGAQWQAVASRSSAAVTLSLWAVRLAVGTAAGDTVLASFVDSNTPETPVAVARKAVSLHVLSSRSPIQFDAQTGLSFSGPGLGALALSNVANVHRAFLRIGCKIGAYNTLDLTPSAGWQETLQPASVTALADNGDDALMLRGELDVGVASFGSSNPNWAVSGDSESLLLALSEVAAVQATSGELVANLGLFTLETETLGVPATPPSTTARQRVTPTGFAVARTTIDRVTPTGFVSERVVATDEITGELVVTLPAFTMEGYGFEGIGAGGFLEASIGEFTLEASGGLVATASADITIDPLRLVTQGSEKGGILEATIDAFRLEATGQLSAPAGHYGELNKAFDNFTLQATGGLLITGALQTSIGDFTLVAEGADTSGTGDLIASLGEFTLEATGSLAGVPSGEPEPIAVPVPQVGGGTGTRVATTTSFKRFGPRTQLDERQEDNWPAPKVRQRAPPPQVRTTPRALPRDVAARAAQVAPPVAAPPAPAPSVMQVAQQYQATLTELAMKAGIDIAAVPELQALDAIELIRK